MKKKVLHIGTSGGRGGIESFILNMSSQIDKDKYNFSIIADCEKAIIEDDFKKIGDVIYIPAITKNKLGYIKGLWHAINKKSFDIVHIHKNSLSNPFPVLICKMKGIKNIVLHSHNTMPTDGGANVMIHKLFRKLMQAFSLKRLACSKLAAEWMFGKKKSSDAFILRNGVHADKLRFDTAVRAEKRTELGIADETLAVCNVGRLSQQKNTLFLLKIFEELCRQKPNSALFLIGKGPLEDEAKAYAEASEFGNKIHFLGIRQDIPMLLQAMDLFLMPSLHEGLPIAAVEAQAAGLPLLISDTVDSDVVICNSTEIEALDATTEKWAKHIIELAEKSVRSDCTEVLAKAGYDIDTSANVLEEIYLAM